MTRPTRRAVTMGIAGAALAGRPAFADVPPLPTSPVAINLVDVAGNLALTQKAIETYARNNPKLVSRVTCTKSCRYGLADRLGRQAACSSPRRPLLPMGRAVT